MTARPTIPVFDIGGVLLDWNPRYLYRKLLAEEAAVEAFLAEIGFDEWNRGFDAGTTFAEGVEAHTARYPHHRALIAAYHDRWAETVERPVEGTAAILDELKTRSLPVYAITNFAAEKLVQEQQRWPFLNRFDGVVVSSEVRAIKPDPAIYRHLLDRYGLEAGTCLFIDDVEKNVAGARAVGMHAVHFTGAAQLRRDLEAVGLL